MTNREIWDKVKRPPASALREIKGGRLKGKTDISPQWRLEIMTEVFGPIGRGWGYTIEKLWTEPGAEGEVMAFAQVNLYAPLFWDSINNKILRGQPSVGIGGSMMIAKESGGLRANDECYKMAITDALSVAMKQLGVA